MAEYPQEVNAAIFDWIARIIQAKDPASSVLKNQA